MLFTLVREVMSLWGHKPFIAVRLLGPHGHYPSFEIRTPFHLFIPGDKACWSAVVQPALPRSFYAPGPSFDDLSYYRFALVAVPTTPAELTRHYSKSAPAAMTIVPPDAQEGLLEVGIVGQRASSNLLKSLTGDWRSVVLVDGPRSDTTIFFRYNP